MGKGASMIKVRSGRIGFYDYLSSLLATNLKIPAAVW